MLNVPGTNFGSVGRGFESLRAGHQFSCTIGGRVSQPKDASGDARELRERGPGGVPDWQNGTRASPTRGALAERVADDLTDLCSGLGRRRDGAGGE